MIEIRSYILLFLAGLLNLLALLSTGTAEPLPIDVALSIKEFNYSPISLSPDGQFVAYTLQMPSSAAPMAADHLVLFTDNGVSYRANGAEVWVANTRTHEQFQISVAKSSSWSPSWSPDGRSVAFYSDGSGVACLWVWDLATRVARSVGAREIHVAVMFEPPVWSPNGRTIYTKVLSPNAASDPSPYLRASETTSLTPFVLDTEQKRTDNHDAAAERSRELGIFDPYRADLVAVDIATGREKSLAIDEAITGWWVSPKGDTLAFAAYEKVDDQFIDTPPFKLHIVELASGRTRVIGQDLRIGIFGIAVNWSPDGRYLAYLAHQKPGYDVPLDCYIVDVTADSPPLLLSKSLHPPRLKELLVPVWTSDSNAVVVLQSNGVYIYQVNGKERLIQTEFRAIALPVSLAHPYIDAENEASFYLWERNQSTMETEIHRVNLRDGIDHRVTHEEIALADFSECAIDRSRDGSSVAYVSQSAQSPPDIWIADREFYHRERVTTINPQLVRYAFGPNRLITWRSDEGRPLRGMLLLPPDFTPGKPVPLVVNLYGGDLSSDRMHLFGDLVSIMLNSQLLATRGYAVLQPDTPLGNAAPMLDLLKDVLPGVSRTVELGFAKDDAVGVMGGSFGGYSALSLITLTNRFRAAFAIAPVTNLFDAYMHLDPDGTNVWSEWAVNSQPAMKATPWDRRDRYIENSPVFLADRIKTPVLLAVGRADDLTLQDTRAMFVALKQLGRTVEYVEYPHAGHLPNAWIAEHKRDIAIRMIAWFDRYLKQPQ